MSEKRTTETLRATLFDTLEMVKNGDMPPNDAKAIALIADNIIDTAELELRYSEVLSRLDMEDQGISPGPLLLTNKNTQ